MFDRIQCLFILSTKKHRLLCFSEQQITINVYVKTLLQEVEKVPTMQYGESKYPYAGSREVSYLQNISNKEQVTVFQQE